MFGLLRKNYGAPLALEFAPICICGAQPPETVSPSFALSADPDGLPILTVLRSLFDYSIKVLLLA